tara:strand:+ start:21551 stop:22645 length:1095 start_codon:yes stop_codon:yes gene_type:complete
MKIKEIISHLELLAPPSLQESYDNSGLIVGNQEQELSKALICLDSTEAIIDDAIKNRCNLVIAHHPILFSGIKSLTGKNYIERTILKAIKNDVAIYAIHTNLDNVMNGVNHKLAEKLNLENCKILNPRSDLLKKLVFFCPLNAAEKVKNTIFEAGAGKIGAYDCCSFQVEGNGNFRAGNNSNPHVGKKGEIHVEPELRIETVFESYLENRVINSLLDSHPYEEVAYDLYSVSQKWHEVGSGMIGELSEGLDTEEFLDFLKLKLNIPFIRHTQIIKTKVKKIAICGGSGSFLLSKAIDQKADLFISADFKYHQFFDANKQITIVDIGHYESEQYTAEHIAEYLQEKIPNFAPYLSTINTNPINYR